MNEHDFEDRISTYGSRWRDAHPFARDVDVTHLSRRSSRKTVVAIVAVAAVIVAALGVAVLVRDTDSSNKHPVAPPTTLVTASTVASAPGAVPAPLKPAGQTQLFSAFPSPAPIAVGNGRVWVGTPTGIVVFTETMRYVGRVPTALPVLALASADELWVLTGRDSDLDTAKNAPYRLERIETTRLAVAFSQDLPFTPDYRSHEQIRLAASDGTAWVSLYSSVLRVDADGNNVTPISLSGRGAGNIAADNTGLWITSNFSTGPSLKIVPMLHIDAANEVAVIPGVPNGFSWSVATAHDAAWVVTATGADGLTLVRIDELTHAVTTYPIAGIALVTGDDQLWVQVIDPTGRTLNYDNLVGQIDTNTGAITRTYKIAIGQIGGSSGNGYASPPFAVTDGKIWSAYDGLQRTTLDNPTDASTTSTTVTVPASIPPTDQALDLRTGTAFGFGPAGMGMKAQTVRDVLTRSLGPPTRDTGWFLTESKSPEDCIGHINTRIIRWGNLSYAFWHLKSDQSDQYTLWSWALGSGVDLHEPPPTVDRLPVLPATTTEGIGIGTSLAELRQQYGAKLSVADDQQSATLPSTPGNFVIFLLTDGNVSGIQSRIGFC